MKLVYSHPNSMILGNMSSALNEIGIETEIRNDILGGAIGEISPGETWIELWVVRKTQAEAATARIKEILEQPAPFSEQIITLPILQTTDEGDLVLDPFSGSHTTGRVANRYGRKYVGYDIHPY